MSLDDYEATYMVAPDERVLFADKSSESPLASAAIIALVTAGLIALPMLALWLKYGAMGMGPLELAMMSVPVLIYALLVAVLFAIRVVVTDQHVHIQQGLLGPSIPLSAIVSCEVVERRLIDQFKLESRRGQTYEPAFRGRGWKAVKIEWLDERGRVHDTRVASPRATELAGAIADAMQQEEVILDLEGSVASGASADGATLSGSAGVRRRAAATASARTDGAVNH